MDHPAPTHASAPPAHSHGAAADAAHVAVHVWRYVIVGSFEVLMSCLTVWLSLQRFGSSAGKVTVILLAACVNATAVGAYMMHLKSERALVWRVLTLTAAFFFILFFLTLLYWSSPITGSTHTHH